MDRHRQQLHLHHTMHYPTGTTRRGQQGVPKMMKVPSVLQDDNTLMPAIGLGTYTSTGGECKRSIKEAIDAGYRLFDTAYYYENEVEVGEAIKEKIDEGIIKREDVFIITKLWCHFHDPDKVEYACKLSLKNFDLDYVDLYLMHWPYGYPYEGDNVMFPTDHTGSILLSDVDYVDTWKAMEKLVELGLTKRIGVSNFNSEQLMTLLSIATIKPLHNQIEVHPGLNQKPLIDFCRSNNIIVTASCPLGRPNITSNENFINNPQIIAIGEKHKKSAAQVILRWHLENGVIPIPKTIKTSRIVENINIFDFKLDEEDHKIMDGLNTGLRIISMTHAIKSPYYPFDEDICHMTEVVVED